MYCGAVKRWEIIHIEAMFADKKICLALLMGQSWGADEVWESSAWLFTAITDVAHGKQRRARRAMSTKERGRRQEAREQAPGGGGRHHQKSSQQNGLLLLCPLPAENAAWWLPLSSSKAILRTIPAVHPTSPSSLFLVFEPGPCKFIITPCLL